MNFNNYIQNHYKHYKQNETFWLTSSLLLCFIICLIIQNFYIQFTGVIGDQEYYLGLLGGFKDGEIFSNNSRTNLTYAIFKILRFIFGNYFATFILPLITTFILFKLVYPYWKYINKKNLFKDKYNCEKIFKKESIFNQIFKIRF